MLTLGRLAKAEREAGRKKKKLAPFFRFRHVTHPRDLPATLTIGRVQDRKQNANAIVSRYLKIVAAAVSRDRDEGIAKGIYSHPRFSRRRGKCARIGTLRAPIGSAR